MLSCLKQETKAGMDGDTGAAWFPQHLWEKIGFYVYRLVDGRDGATFYVGKGYGNRVFQHAIGITPGAELDEGDGAKRQRIQAIIAAGRSVDYVIHRHGLSEAEAFHVEAALIDAYPGLTNLQLGNGVDRNGQMSVREIMRLYELPPFPRPEHKLLLIKIPKLNRRATLQEIYDLTRYCWRINRSRAEATEYVISVHLGRTIAAFEADQWLPATKENFGADFAHADGSESHRHGFKGKPAQQDIWELYVGAHGKRIEDERYLRMQYPLAYMEPSTAV